MVSSYDELKQISRSQKRQQLALMILSVVLAASTIVTWKAVGAMREANTIQKEVLESRKESAPRKAALRRPNARLENQASSDSQRPRGSTRSSAQKQAVDQPAAAESAPRAPFNNTQALMARPGRQ